MGNRQCFFCQAPGKLTVEHVLPRWTEKVLGLGELTMSDGTGTTHRTTSGIWDLKFRGVCESCNTGWMSGVEARFKDLMSPALQGRTVVLTLDDQLHVATWIMKTALLLEPALAYRRGHAYTPSDNFHWMFENRCPPPNALIWVGRFDCRDRRASATAGTLAASEDHPVGYLATFTLGYLFCQVLGRPATGWKLQGRLTVNGQPIGPPPPWDKALRAVWPRSSRVEWPPERGIGHAGLTRASNWPLQMGVDRYQYRGDRQAT